MLVLVPVHVVHHEVQQDFYLVVEKMHPLKEIVKSRTKLIKALFSFKKGE